MSGIIMENKMFDVIAVLNNDQDVKYLMNSDFKVTPYLTIYDERYRDSKKKAWALKSEYGAKETPFIEIKVDGQFVKAIWREACEDPLKELTEFLNK